MMQSRNSFIFTNLSPFYQFKPVFCFIAFFQRNLKFCNKIRSAVRVVCFPYVCADAGGGAFQLINERIMPFYTITQSQYFNSKIH